MIGIHLGANYTRVAIMKDGYPTMVREIDIPRDGNADRFASVVSFRSGQIRFGAEAFKNQEAEIIFDACRFSPNYTSDVWHANRNSEGKYQVHVLRDEYQTISQEEVISKILSRIRDIVVSRYGDSFIQNVVLSYPECTLIYQDLLKNAAHKAGFDNNVELLEERIAAAKTFYKISPPSQYPHYLLVFKFGAGSFEISVFEKKTCESDFEQLESIGEQNLGGEDITNLLIWDCQKNFKEKLEKSEIRNKDLRESCERVKSDLSYFAETKIFLDGDPLCDINRDGLETLCKEIVEKINHHLQFIANRIKSRGIKINDVLLVGGSTRLCFIQNLIDSALKTAEKIEYHYDTVVNREEAIVMGCAIYAETIPNSPIPKSPKEDGTKKMEIPTNNSPTIPNEDENGTSLTSTPNIEPDLEMQSKTDYDQNIINATNRKDSFTTAMEVEPCLPSEHDDKNSQHGAHGIDDKNKLSEQKFPDEQVQNLQTAQTNSDGSISSVKTFQSRTLITEEEKSLKSKEIDIPNSSTENEKRQIEQILKDENTKNTMKGSSKSSESSKSSSHQITPPNETVGPKQEIERPIVKGPRVNLPKDLATNIYSQGASNNSSMTNTTPKVQLHGNPTKEDVYTQIKSWFKKIDKSKHLSEIEKINFATLYGKTEINKLSDCAEDEVVLMNFLRTAEMNFQQLKFKHDILEQFDQIKDKLTYTRVHMMENDIYKNCLDKLNEKRDEVDLATHIKLNDKSCDDCINDLHMLLGTHQAVLKSPVRSANAKVNKWQEDELVQVLIKPQLHQCIYTKGSMSYLLKKT